MQSRNMAAIGGFGEIGGSAKSVMKAAAKALATALAAAAWRWLGGLSR